MVVSPILMGGLGNSLFQICATLSYSLKYKCDYFIPTKIHNPHYEGQKIFYSKYIKYLSKEPQGVKNIHIEQSFEYQGIPEIVCDWLELSGYFQSYKYFNDYREEILEILDVPYEYKEGWIFIHYRAGDYKVLGNFHKIISDEYLIKSILYFVSLGFENCMVFSDEIDLAEEKINALNFKELKFEYSEGRTEVEDLALMASCEGGIMSASSFSWWGAWLGQNENRKIIYPSDWFGEQLGHHNTEDLCPKNWIAI